VGVRVSRRARVEGNVCDEEFSEGYNMLCTGSPSVIGRGRGREVDTNISIDRDRQINEET
jgi:hypothetical protein